MIATAKLKTQIIDLAVSGKISVQFQPSDSVSEIIASLPEVSNKRKTLLKQRFEYGKQYDIPPHWKWIRLGEITSYGDTPTKAFYNDVTEDTWILDLEDIKSGGELIAKTRVYDKKFVGDKTVFRKGHILYSKLRPYLKKVLVADEDGISSPELISFNAYGGVIPQYIVFCLLSSFTDRAIEKRSYGIKMPRVDAGFMVNLPIPLPPVSEQIYIVNHVQAALSQIDTIDILQSQYADNLTSLKSKLIDAAIQGKLTEQLPEDGTAEELYQQIQEEKQALIKAGKIKKEKLLPEIKDEDLPFEIPDNWKWCRVSDFAYLTSGNQYEETENGILYVKVADMNLNDNLIEIVTSSRFTPDNNPGKIPLHSIIFPKRGGAILTNKKRLVKKSPIYIDSNVMAMTVILPEILPYIRYWFDSVDLGELYTGTSIPQINNKDIYPMLVPIPPLAEQKRIVEKLDEILNCIEVAQSKS